MDQALVIGASGFVGRRLLARLGDRGLGTHRGRATAGTVPFDATTERLRDRLPDFPTGLTHVFVPFGAIDMEGCAADYAATARVNVDAVIGVLSDALDAGLKPIFVSTDYVFGGERSLSSERDEARPRMAYGRQKLQVERWLAERGGDWTICRLSKVLSDEMEPANMLAGWASDLHAGRPLRVADDQYFSPAGADDLARAMILLAEVESRGLFHVAGPERISRFELFERLRAAMAGLAGAANAEVTTCSLHDFGFRERRPLDTSLATDLLQSTVAMDFSSIDELCRTVARRSLSAES